MAYSFDPRVEEALALAAQRNGVPLEAMRALAQIESGGNPSAQNPSSSAGGLLQFTNSTARQYGLKDKFDPYQNADAGARLMRDNYNGLAKTLGRAPTTGELYLAHQQGLGGARQLLSNPNAPAASIVGKAAVTQNAGSAGMTAGEFANLWVNKANRLAGQIGQGAQQVAQAVIPGMAAVPVVPAASQGIAALPTAQAADPMGGIFSLLMQARSAQPAAPAMAAPMVRKAPDTRSEDEKLASVSDTPDVYMERLKRKASYG